jgi:tRNA-splicing ligase RtcB
MLSGGARWAVERGYGTGEDLDRIEDRGCVTGAKPGHVSGHAKRRQQDEEESRCMRSALAPPSSS